MLAGREHRLSRALEAVRDRYQLVIIDCPPALNILTVNALTAADSVLIPMQCEYYALEGLSGLISTIEQIRDSVNPRLVIEGILRTMFDPRNNLSNDVAAQLIEHFGERVFRTIIPRTSASPRRHPSACRRCCTTRTSRGALATSRFAGEMIRRSEDPSLRSRIAGEAEAEPDSEPESFTRPVPYSAKYQKKGTLPF